MIFVEATLETPEDNHLLSYLTHSSLSSSPGGSSTQAPIMDSEDPTINTAEDTIFMKIDGTASNASQSHASVQSAEQDDGGPIRLTRTFFGGVSDTTASAYSHDGYGDVQYNATASTGKLQVFRFSNLRTLRSLR